jgi:hypothetical protein
VSTLELPDGAVIEVAPPPVPVVEVVPPAVDGIEITVIPGPPGPRGPAGDGGFTHVQDTPSASWVIDNTLGRYPASVTVWIDGEEITTDVFTPDVNTIQIVHAVPVAGRAEII